MIYNCKVVRSCIYWDKDARETTKFTVDANSVKLAKDKLRDTAVRMEISTGSKLVQDACIQLDGVWESIFQSSTPKVNEDGI